MPDASNISPAKYRRLKLAERVAQRASSMGQTREGRILWHACTEIFEQDNPAFIDAISRMKKTPVTIDEFVESGEFLGDIIEVWPALRDDLRVANPDVMAGMDPCYLAFEGGGTGAGKSFKAQISQLYQIYLLSCFNDPQRMYRMASSTPIVFTQHSTTEGVARRVLYEPMRALFEACPYFQKWVKWDKRNTRQLRINNGRIICLPMVAHKEAIVGQAIMGAIMDEANYLVIIRDSKQVPGANGMGGEFDQAKIMYHALTQRQKSRFLTRGPWMGLISVISSARYKGDFMETRMNEAVKNEEQGVQVFRRAQYDVQPPDRYCGKRFRVMVGTTEFETTLLEDDQPPPSLDGDVIEVPIEYLPDFQRDPDDALREVSGISSGSIRTFIARRHKIAEAMSVERKGVANWMPKGIYRAADGMPRLNPKLLRDFDKSDALEYFAHVDLAISGDKCGIAVARIEGEVERTRMGVVEAIPLVRVVCAFSIDPQGGNEVDITGVRRWLAALKLQHGINLRRVTYDGFQSAESRQALRREGIQTGLLSLDRDTKVYETFKRGLYDDAIILPPDEMLTLELGNLEYNTKRDKVDHPPKMGKDMADAVAGAYYGAATSRKARVLRRIGAEQPLPSDTQDEAVDDGQQEDTPKVGAQQGKGGRRKAMPRRRSMRA